MVRFPVYVRDDANDVMSFSSYETMKSYLEPIDIENREYASWDADGHFLEFSVGRPKSEWLKISQLNRVLSRHEFAELKKTAVAYRDPEPLKAEG